MPVPMLTEAQTFAVLCDRAQATYRRARVLVENRRALMLRGEPIVLTRAQQGLLAEFEDADDGLRAFRSRFDASRSSHMSTTGLST